MTAAFIFFVLMAGQTPRLVPQTPTLDIEDCGQQGKNWVSGYVHNHPNAPHPTFVCVPTQMPKRH